MSYECTFICSPELDSTKVEDLVVKVSKIIETADGKIKNLQQLGKKKLAYLINKESEAEYVVFDFNSDSEFPKELDRICQITDGVLRSMIVKKS